MTVVLVAIEDAEGKIFLVEREKRPFLGKLFLPGERMIVGENFQGAASRIGKRFGVSCEFEKVCSVSLEHVKKEDGENKLHSFLLVLVKASGD